MNPFEYLSVLVSIVLGLGLSHLLSGAAQLVRFRADVRFHGTTLLWMALLFLVYVQVWWAVFELRGTAVWTFVGFLMMLAIPTVLFLLVYLLVPDFDRETRIDLRESFHAQRLWFFGGMALVPVLSLAQETVMSGGVARDADVAFRLAFLGFALLGLATGREWVHRAIALASLAGFVAYVSLLFVRLA